VIALGQLQYLRRPDVPHGNVNVILGKPLRVPDIPSFLSQSEICYIRGDQGFAMVEPLSDPRPAIVVHGGNTRRSNTVGGVGWEPP
jgi:hypothetical protein